MRLALISDLHGNLPALDAVLADCATRGIDAIVNLGDHLSGPLWPVETAERLMALPFDVLHLAGNHDRALAHRIGMEAADHAAASEIDASPSRERIMAWLATCAPTTVRDDALFFHGTPDDDLTYAFETVTPTGIRLATPDELRARLGTPAARLLACGHSHQPRLLRDAEGRLMVNPGSVGLPAYRDSQPYPHAVETGSPDARYALVERDASGGWRGQLLAVPYDHLQAAARAAERGRPDWAHALSTGYALPES